MIGKQTFTRVPPFEYVPGLREEGDDVNVTSFGTSSELFKADAEGMGTFCLRAEDWEQLGKPERIELTIRALAEQPVPAI